MYRHEDSDGRIMEAKRLNPYKGWVIEKSYEIHPLYNTIKKDTVIYTAVSEDGTTLLDACHTLKELKKIIDSCEKRGKSHVV